MSFRCHFCHKAQGKGKRPTLLITDLHEASQFDKNGQLVSTTIEVKAEKPACEACVATNGGQEALVLRKQLGQPLYPQTQQERELEESLLDTEDAACEGEVA